MEKIESLFVATDLFAKIRQQIKSDKFAQTCIVTSPDVFSNNTFAAILAKALICENTFCDNCEQCAKTNNQTHPDLHIFATEKAFAVADVTSILDDVYKSAFFKNKVYVIQNIDTATIPAQNKLLKILEEPPQNVYFVLTATNTASVLQTILSRSIKIRLQPFDKGTLKDYTQNAGFVFSDDGYEYSEGYVGKLLDFLQNKNFNQVFQNTFEILKNVKKSSDIILYSETIKKEDMSTFLQALQTFMSDILYIKSGNQNLVESKFKAELVTLAQEFSLPCILSINNSLVVAKTHLLANCNYAIIKDKLLLQILEAKYVYKDN